MSVNFEKLRIVYKWPPLETAIRDDDEHVSSTEHERPRPPVRSLRYRKRL